jgi:hypothetical protein
VFLSNAPDGTCTSLLYRGIIEHRISITGTFAIRLSRASWNSQSVTDASIV